MTTTTTDISDSVDPAGLEEFVGRFTGDLGAVLHAATVLIGDRLGLYKAMSDCRWCSPEELAERSGTHLRYIREWLAAQAASGYAQYEPASGRLRLTPEQAFALTSEENPLFVPGGVQLAAATTQTRPHRQRVQNWLWGRLGRAPPGSGRGHTSLLSTELHR